MESLPAVLIVDDDRIVLRTMQDQLSRENYRVAALSNVAEALQRIRIERFGIIMADQFMPETPGLEFLRTCRETPFTARATADRPVGGGNRRVVSANHLSRESSCLGDRS